MCKKIVQNFVKPGTKGVEGKRVWRGERKREKEIDKVVRGTRRRRRCDISTAQSTKMKNITLCTKP